ncbi:MAG: HU family DNA-binding protein [Deltaproteobacteria bacterium]|nr:HU family DNA-binding protein [Deltaproteobacteria bacterium]
MVAGKRMTKAQIMSELADKSGLTKKEITGVFDALREHFESL